MARAEPAPTRPFWPRFALIAGLGSAAIALAALSQFGRGHALMINTSPSLPYWAIWLDRSATPARGDIVLFDPPESDLVRAHFGADPQAFGKVVLGLPGDTVSETDRRFAINGRDVAFAKPVSLRGEALALGPTGTIPPDCFYVGTAHKDSFDSRYAAIGWICKDRILGVGRPVL